LQLERVKAKIKASKSQEEAESLKFAQKNLINKVLVEAVVHIDLSCTICLRNCYCFLELEKVYSSLQCLFISLLYAGILKYYDSVMWLNTNLWFIQFQIYTDSAEAKIPAVLDYVGTVIEVWRSFFSFKKNED
jgi:hypothetical protein